MAYKLICDGCGEEIRGRNTVSQRLTRSKQKNGKLISVEVMVAVDRLWNGGEVCEACLLEIINTGSNDAKGYLESKSSAPR